MNKLINRVQEALDNNWAVEAEDIQSLLDRVIIAETLVTNNHEVASARKKALDNLLILVNRRLYLQYDPE